MTTSHPRAAAGGFPAALSCLAAGLFSLGFVSEAAAVGTPPSITVGNYSSTLEDHAFGIGFTVSDAETPAQNLQVTVTSDNPMLVTNASLVVGPGASASARWLNIQPVADAVGQATLTFTVVDGDGLSASKDMLVDVTPVNDAPSIVVGSSRVHPTGTSGQMVSYGFASDIRPGPDDEAGQWVDFETTVESDPRGILANALMNQNGDLEYGLSGQSGEAVLRVVPVDDGGTADGGQYRGLPSRIHIAVGEGVDLVAKIRREVNYTRGTSTQGSPIANYLVEVMNNGPIDVNGVALHARVRYGLVGVTWTCTVPDSVCSVDNGSGDVNVVVDLPSGTMATVNLVGTLDPLHHFLRIDSWTAPPNGMPLLLPFDDQKVYIEAIDGIGLFKDGLE